jgi:hypothetical protein
MKPVVARTAVLLLAVVPGCGQSPPEPAQRGTDGGVWAPPSRGAAASPGGAETARPSSRRPLEWETPAGWNVERTAERGSYRLKAQVPPVGNDKAPADFLARVVGRSDGVDADAELSAFFREFDGDVGSRARREALDAGGMAVRVVEVAGDYKQPMGPPMGPRGKHAAYVIQRGWRGIAAVAATPQRDVWLFRLVGPSDTVESARSAMHALLRSLRIGGADDDRVRPSAASPPTPSSSPTTDAAHER